MSNIRVRLERKHIDREKTVFVREHYRAPRVPIARYELEQLDWLELFDKMKG